MWNKEADDRMHGVYHPSTAQLDYTPAGKRTRSTQHRNCCAPRRAEPQHLYRQKVMAECKRFIATWKEPDEDVAWYEKPLHGTWHKAVSDVADMACTYQRLY